MRVATWNLERRKPTSPRGAEAITYLQSVSADLVVITETRISFGLPGGTTAWSEPPVGSRFAPDERKVVLWSAYDFDVINVDSPIDSTRFVAARVHTPLGSLVVLAVCITWHMAEVTYHHGPKKKPWEEHFAYLEHLVPIVDSIDEPLVVAGDFNQRYPRVKGGNLKAAAALEATFKDLTIVTAGTLTGCTRPGIDHIAISSELTASNVVGWPNNVTGNRLSDHDGAACDVAPVSGSIRTDFAI